MSVELKSASEKQQWQAMRSALKHCRAIKACYQEKRKSKAYPDQSYTHIPMDLWEVIEKMLADEAISLLEEQ